MRLGKGVLFRALMDAFGDEVRAAIAAGRLDPVVREVPKPKMLIGRAK
jgi:hypothetical protein